MKIFVLLPRIPWPLEKGDKLRAFNQIKQLAKNNEVILCALNTNQKAKKEDAFKALQPYCKSITFIDISKYSILINLTKAFFKRLPMLCSLSLHKVAIHLTLDKLSFQFVNLGHNITTTLLD